MWICIEISKLPKVGHYVWEWFSSLEIKSMDALKG